MWTRQRESQASGGRASARRLATTPSRSGTEARGLVESQNKSWAKPHSSGGGPKRFGPLSPRTVPSQTIAARVKSPGSSLTEEFSPGRSDGGTNTISHINATNPTAHFPDRLQSCKRLLTTVVTKKQ